MMIANAFFLIYTTVMVPVQICLWNYDDPCNRFPTLYFDVMVDAFFMVGVERFKSLLYSQHAIFLNVIFPVLLIQN